MGIKEEIKQTKDFDCKQTELVISLIYTTDKLNFLIDEKLKPFSLTQQQYNILRILRGSKETGLPTMEIASRMLNVAPNVTRIIDRLICKNLVDRQNVSSDRRQVVVKITQNGLDLLSQFDLTNETMNKDFLKKLSDEKINSLLVLLDEVRESLTTN
ncbi:MarR family transcriptional regulator [bacterium]|nr:MarR family transcriptional regulator [bacterium]